jgi:hypothetical protein
MELEGRTSNIIYRVMAGPEVGEGRMRFDAVNLLGAAGEQEENELPATTAN